LQSALPQDDLADDMAGLMCGVEMRTLQARDLYMIHKQQLLARSGSAQAFEIL